MLRGPIALAPSWDHCADGVAGFGPSTARRADFELFPAHFGGRSRPSFGELTLDHHLGWRCPGVVVREPQGIVAAHEMPAGLTAIDIGVLEHVAHCGGSRSHWRRNNER